MYDSVEGLGRGPSASRYQGLEEEEEDCGSDGCVYVHRDMCIIVSRAWAVVKLTISV
jgi:hypothetical protein